MTEEVSASGGAFYISFDCAKYGCSGEILYGPCLTLNMHNGVPVIPYDIASQTSVTCPDCGTVNYTVDAELYYEGEEEGNDDED